jgi:predicted aspartyl protease
MSTFIHPIEIANLDHTYTRKVEAVVNAAVFITIAPSRLLRKLGIEPTGARRFEMTNGAMREMDIGNAYVTIDGHRVATILAFGDDTAPLLLGKDTLIGLALAPDPDGQRFVSSEPLPL